MPSFSRNSDQLLSAQTLVTCRWTKHTRTYGHGTEHSRRITKIKYILRQQMLSAEKEEMRQRWEMKSLWKGGMWIEPSTQEEEAMWPPDGGPLRVSLQQLNHLLPVWNTDKGSPFPKSVNMLRRGRDYGLKTPARILHRVFSLFLGHSLHSVSICG